MLSVSYTGTVGEDVAVGDACENAEHWQVKVEQCQRSNLKKSHQVHLWKCLIEGVLTGKGSRNGGAVTADLPICYQFLVVNSIRCGHTKTLEVKVRLSSESSE